MDMSLKKKHLNISRKYKEMQYNLARCYENRIGVEKDKVKPFKLYQIVVEKEFSNTQSKLKLMKLYNCIG